MERKVSIVPGGGAHPRTQQVLGAVRRLSHVLDDAFRIPGTRLRFGWDPLIGLIPGIGDLVGTLASLFIVMQAFRLGVPHIVKARMVLNVLIDLLVGAIPFAGDIFDFAWKSNSRNLALLEKHAGTGVRPDVADWAFVLGTAAVALVIAAVPILLLIFLFSRLQTWIHGPSLWNI